MPPEPAGPLHSAQLEAAWLTRVSFHENTDFELGRQNIEVSLDQTGRTEFEDDTTALFRLAATVMWTLDGADADEETETPFELEIEVAGRFTWEGGQMMDRDYATGWLDFNATYLLWPYLRAYAAMITGASSLPPLTIYTLEVPRPRTGATDTGEFEAAEASEAEAAGNGEPA